MLGLTAKPFPELRKSEQGLLKKVFPDDIVYKIDLRTLIRLGILSEPHFEEVTTGLNFIKDLSEEQIEQLNYFDIDSIGTGIAKTIAENDERNHTIVNKYLLNKDKYKQTIVFALNVDNAIALNALFNEVGVKSDYKQICDLVAINKIEEFAILTNKIIDPEKREELEKLNFIERFPLGIYQFRFLEQHNDDEPIERNCEILVYDNILQSYTDFVNALQFFFRRVQNSLTENLFWDEEDELEDFAKQLKEEFFKKEP
ncbi:hypothetical protein FQR65_LT15428 [Abscondita terminalis]|nr:hypothetical protein FQR65_LT15428 [Abscondita terminalis]